MKCQKCGAENEENYRYCGKCGTPLTNPAIASSIPPAPKKPDPGTQHDSAQTSPHIFLFVKDERKGPFALSQVQAMWNSGNITAETQYWHEGMSEWQPLTSLFDARSSSEIAQPANTSTAPNKVTYVQSADAFKGTLPMIMRLVIKAVQACGYKIDNANENLGILTFQTGTTWGSWSGASCSISFEEVGEYLFHATASGKQNVRGGQLMALDLFDEARGKARNVIKKMIEFSQ